MVELAKAKDGVQFRTGLMANATRRQEISAAMKAYFAKERKRAEGHGS